MVQKVEFLQLFKPDGWEIYGSYLNQGDYLDFNLGIESTAGRALVNAQTRIVELCLEGDVDQITSTDDWLAGFVVSEAIKHGHVNITDLPNNFIPTENQI